MAIAPRWNDSTMPPRVASASMGWGCTAFLLPDDGIAGVPRRPRRSATALRRSGGVGRTSCNGASAASASGGLYPVATMAGCSQVSSASTSPRRPADASPSSSPAGRCTGRPCGWTRIDPLPALAAFDAMLAEPGPWLGAFDFPFGLPRGIRRCAVARRHHRSGHRRGPSPLRRTAWRSARWSTTGATVASRDSGWSTARPTPR